MRCPQCQSEVKEGAKFCGNCGASIPIIPPHFCGRCGSKITDTPDKVCAACRAKEQQTVAADTTGPVKPGVAATVQPVLESPPPLPKGSKFKGLLVALLVVVALGGAAAYYLLEMGGLEQVQMAVMLTQADKEPPDVLVPSSLEEALPAAPAPEDTASASAEPAISQGSAPSSAAPAAPEAPAASSAPAPAAPAAYEQKDWEAEIAQMREKYAPVSVRFVPVSGAEELSNFQNGIARIKRNGEWGLLSSNTLELLTDPENGRDVMGYEQMMLFSEEMVAVKSGGKWGYLHISMAGSKAIPCVWDSANDFSNGYAVVTMNEQYGLIDKTGQLAIAPRYENMRAYAEGLLPVCENGKWGYVDIDGNTRLPFVFEDAGAFSSGVAVVVQEGRTFFIDVDGTKVTGDFDDAWTFKNNSAKVQVGTRYGLIDATGSYLVTPDWDNIWNMQEGVATVQRDGRYGYVNQRNEIVVPPIYNSVWSSNLGLIPVETSNGQWGYIDQQDNLVIAAQYSDAYNFSEGVGRVGKNGSYALIDSNGTVLTGFSYKVMGYVTEGYCPVMTSDNRWGYLQITY